VPPRFNAFGEIMTSVAMVRPVEATSVVERVTAEIRQAIVTGRLAPGQEFSLRHIAAQLGVSFIPVREALRSLEAEGLLETRRGRSAIVAPLNLEELHAICQLCRLIEPDVRVRSARLMRPADLDRLELALDALLDGCRTLDESYQRSHVFHTELVRPAATAWDLRILERLWRALERYVRFGSRRPDRDGSDARFPDPAPKRALLAAYRSGDPDAVREATLRNIDAQERIGGRGLEHVRP
jgi:DNA-binding GntR family transcriptional regulator